VTTRVNTVTPSADAEQALAMVRAGLSYLAAADATQMAAQVQAQCLHGLEQATAPECAAVLNTVLDALSAPQGAADTRSHEQRYHDALEEAMRRLVAAGLLPERAGQPAKVIAHISLADLLDLDTDSVLHKQ
jgi:Domain of unknown function (DUF222)